MLSTAAALPLSSQPRSSQFTTLDRSPDAQLDYVVSHFDQPKRTARGWMVRCSGHDDSTQSLSLDLADDASKILAYCHAGCSHDHVLATSGLSNSDFQVGAVETHRSSPAAKERGLAGSKRITAIYQYLTVGGEIHSETVRFSPKSFQQRRPDGKGGYVWSLRGITTILYHLPEIELDKTSTVFLVEGEKDSDRLLEHGLLATTCPMGAKSWKDHYAETLRNRSVVIIPDNDEAGQQFARTAADSLLSANANVRIVNLPSMPPKSDVSDWLDAGHTVEELAQIVTSTPSLAELLDAAGERRIPAEYLVGPQVRSMLEIEERAVQWLWPFYVPRGMLTLLGALPGVGKSTLAMWFAALLSRGGTLPDGTSAPVTNTLLLLAEDSPEYSVKARLRQHDADQSRIFELSVTVDENGRERTVNIRDHIEEIRSVVISHNIGLIVIDPISSFMPNTDRNEEGGVRDALGPFLKMVDESGVAVIGIVHVGKSTDKKHSQQLVMGSTAFTAIARVVIMTADIPDDDPAKPNRKVLQVVKSNIEMKPQPIAWSREHDDEIRWHGVSTITFDDVALRSGNQEPESRNDEAKTFILDATKGGSILSSTLQHDAEATGITKRTFERARSELIKSGSIETVKDRGSSGAWFTRRKTSNDRLQTNFAKDDLPGNAAMLAKLEMLPTTESDFEPEVRQHRQVSQENLQGQLAKLPGEHLDAEVF